jgi:long-subunit acyl-CoA synthetase (AMP-forming)
VNYIERFQRVLEVEPDGWAIEFNNRTTSWRDISGATQGIADALATSSVRDDAALGLIARNSRESAMAAVALTILSSFSIRCSLRRSLPPKSAT